ncbi:helix-turn-helix domain-containing protein [Candidatus Caldatribacterium saccharofermentans]|uniref:helix-turn-helix domain-containing protein n=1 Tax=Candidatus Caldatribacterium saccharofermentans TaxID=1454753 RepID=UPI003D084174
MAERKSAPRKAVVGDMNVERDIEELFEKLRKDRETAETLDYYAPLNALILEVVEERTYQNLTQEELARRLGTRQSAISRFENLGRKPGFDFLQKVARALGGKLFITIHGQYAALVPRKYRELINRLARERDTTPEAVVRELLVEALERKMGEELFAEIIRTVSVPRKNPVVSAGPEESTSEPWEDDERLSLAS